MNNLQLNDLVSVMESEEVKGVEATFTEGVENIQALIDMLDTVEIREDELALQLQKAKQVKGLINDKLMQIRKAINARLS